MGIIQPGRAGHGLGKSVTRSTSALITIPEYGIVHGQAWVPDAQDAVDFGMAVDHEKLQLSAVNLQILKN
jgi:hypothetical protein